MVKPIQAAERKKQRMRRYIVREWLIPDLAFAWVVAAFIAYSLATKGVIELRWDVIVATLLTATVLAAAVSWVLGSTAWKQVYRDGESPPDGDDAP